MTGAHVSAAATLTHAASNHADVHLSEQPTGNVPATTGVSGVCPMTCVRPICCVVGASGTDWCPGIANHVQSCQLFTRLKMLA
jgi:hypothetical protein